MGNNNIGIKKCTTTFLWVLNFGQVRDCPNIFQKHPRGEGFRKLVPNFILSEVEVSDDYFHLFILFLDMLKGWHWVMTTSLLESA